MDRRVGRGKEVSGEWQGLIGWTFALDSSRSLGMTGKRGRVSNEGIGAGVGERMYNDFGRRD